MNRHTMTEIVLHTPQKKHRFGMSFTCVCVWWGWGGGEGEGRKGAGRLNQFYMATTLALISAVVYIRHLIGPFEQFLTHQCNISENIKIKK